MPSELPKFGTPRRGTPVLVPRQSIFSSSVMSKRRLSILFSIGRAGSLNGWEDCCANAGANASTRRLNMLESRFIIVDYYCLDLSVIVTHEWTGIFPHRVRSASAPRLLHFHLCKLRSMIFRDRAKQYQNLKVYPKHLKLVQEFPSLFRTSQVSMR